MKKEVTLAKRLLAGSGMSILDAARIVKNILDAKSDGYFVSPAQFCSMVVEKGKQHIRCREMSFGEGFAAYYKSKRNLRPDSIRDIRCIGNKLLKSRADLAKTNFSAFTVNMCEEWLNASFSTPNQFNKARAMMHGLFEFAFRREWCEKNPVKLVERKKIVEKEIEPLSLAQTRRILKTAMQPKLEKFMPAVCLLIFAGIRPREVRRLHWGDIDLIENTITVRSQCSKTGGVRQVEICPALKRILMRYRAQPETPMCPAGWTARWRTIRDKSGFKGIWVQDVLRHTYASFYAKHFADLPRLQLNMGHCDLSLLRSRYINMRGISKHCAQKFFYPKEN